MKTCPKCEGYGKVWPPKGYGDSTVRCTTCNGTGQVNGARDAASRAGLHRALDAALDAKAKDKISEQVDPTYRRMLAQRLREAREMVKTAEPENRKYWADRIVEIEAILKGERQF